MSARSQVYMTSGKCLGGARLDLHAGRPTHFRRPTRAFEETDDSGRRINLVGKRAVPRGTRVRVVEVVPGFTHRHHAERREVGAAVLVGRRLATEHVTDR